ncbi:MAG: hypothetical protein QM764_19530 [Chitinophagaceae bacterium]
MFSLENILIYSYLLPLFVFLFLKREIRAKSEVIVIVTYSIVFFVLLNFQYLYLDKYPFLNNFFASLYTFSELLFFSLVYCVNLKSKKFNIIATIILIAFGVFQALIIKKSEVAIIDNVAVGIETLIMYLYIFYFFYTKFINIDDQYIYNNYCFWISIGIMLYLGGNFFFYILGSHIPKNIITNYWYFTYIVELAKNILFAISMLVFAKQTKIKFPNKNIPYLDFN